MKKRFFASALVAFTLAVPAVASAQGNQGGNCPPGSWFCADAPAQPAPAGAQPLQPLPSSEAPKTAAPPPPVVVYQPPPPVVIVAPREAPPAYYYAPREAQRRSEWGLNLHLGGVLMGGRHEGRDGDAGMGEIGLGLRFRPAPVFALEADLDFAGGRDYNGFRRGETAFMVNGLFFLNPKSKTQGYLLAGFGWSSARAVDDSQGYDAAEYRYGYFGGQIGVGVELRASKHVALNADLRGFIRGRVDNNTQGNPEFVDTNGRTTNTSGGGLITGGITFYF